MSDVNNVQGISQNIYEFNWAVKEKLLKGNEKLNSPFGSNNKLGNKPYIPTTFSSNELYKKYINTEYTNDEVANIKKNIEK